MFPYIIIPVGLCLFRFIEKFRQFTGRKILTVGTDIGKTLHARTYRFTGEISTEFIAVLMPAVSALSIDTMGTEPDFITAFLKSAFVSPVARNTDKAIVSDFFTNGLAISV